MDPNVLRRVAQTFYPDPNAGSGGPFLAATAPQCAAIIPEATNTDVLEPFTIEGAGFLGHGAVSVVFHRAGPIDFPATGEVVVDAASAPNTFLGTARTFAVLAGSTVTNSGVTDVFGDVGVSPGGAIVGFPPGVVNPHYAQHAADAAAAQAQYDNTQAYLNLQARAVDTDLTGQDLGGMTLTPGVYHFATSAPLTGVLTLDAGGDPDAEFVFQIGSTLVTAPGSSVVLINSARARNVYFQVGSSATLDTTTAFEGNILALASITLNTGATANGHLLAQTGAVTLDTNAVSIADTEITGTTAAMSNGVYDVIITFADATTTTCPAAFTVTSP